MTNRNPIGIVHFAVVGFIVIASFLFYISFKARINDADVLQTHSKNIETSLMIDVNSIPRKRIEKYRRRWAGNGINIDDISFQNRTEAWKETLLRKLICLRLKKCSIYMYHIRRAAGTTVRDVLHKVALRWSAKYHETEGPVLNTEFLNLPGLLTVTTLRQLDISTSFPFICTLIISSE
jgi:hypothetical protein